MRRSARSGDRSPPDLPVEARDGGAFQADPPDESAPANARDESVAVSGDERGQAVDFQVDGLDCAHCAQTVESAVGRLDGVSEVEVLFPSGKVRVVHDPARVGPPAVADAIVRAGYRPRLDAGAGPASGPRWWRRPRVLLLGTSALLMAAGHVFELTGVGPAPVAVGLFLAAVAVGAWFPLRSAWAGLRERAVGINTLLVVATAGALALGLWGEAALLVVIFSLGEVLESFAVDRARGAIRGLVELAPTEATVLAGGEEVRRATDRVEPGELVRVRPGEQVPLDGVVRDGRSTVDQAAVTGESFPVEKAPGERVFAGTLNGHGSLDVEVTRRADDTTLARIVQLVEGAQARKGKAQRFSQRFGAIYTPVMFLVALAIATIPPLALDAAFLPWFYRALVVLVVSCSCSLVLSVPVAVISGITSAARRGILVKGGSVMEALGGVRAVALDKTGTLTTGETRLTDVIPLGGTDAAQGEATSSAKEPTGERGETVPRGDAAEAELLALAAGLEARSEHPVATAVLAAARDRGIEPLPITDFRSRPGRGVEGRIGGRLHRVASPRATEASASPGGSGSPDAVASPGAPSLPSASAPSDPWAPPEVLERIRRLEADGKTTVVVSDENGRVVGVLALADRLRPGAADMVRRLHEMGIEHVILLTGDNRRTAEAVGAELGIDEVRAELLPEDKIRAIEELQARYGAVAMVGDGVNDAPALARADVGVAMGVAGTDVALETADVGLMADDPAQIAEALELSRRTRAGIVQNITLAFLTMAILVPAAALGGLTLVEGLVLNEGAALLVIGNGLRMLRVTKPAHHHRH